MTDPTQPVAEEATTTEPVAKPWYMSKTVLALIAGIILSILAKTGTLPEGVTQDSIADFLLWFVPLALALYGRLTASHILTASATKAKVINQSVT